MTYAEWMQAMGQRFGMTDTDINIVAVNQGIDLTTEVDVTRAKTALVREFATIIPLANVTEGGYTLSWNMDAVKMWYNATCQELGIEPATAPRIRNASNRW